MPDSSPRRRRVLAYFAACGGGTPAEIGSHFTEDAAIYDTNHRPVLGREAIGQFWSRVREQWSGASWHVDTLVEDADGLAIEWSMAGVREGEPFIVRGSEHYAFEGDLIRQIRQYWSFDPEAPASELVDFPYADDPRFRPSS